MSVILLKPILHRKNYGQWSCFSVFYCRFSICRGPIYHHTVHKTALTYVKLWSDFIEPTKDYSYHVADDIFNCIFLHENVWLSIKISLNVFPMGRINNIPALVQIMAWHLRGDKPWLVYRTIYASLGLIELTKQVCVGTAGWMKHQHMEFHFIIFLAYVISKVMAFVTHCNIDVMWNTRI